MRKQLEKMGDFPSPYSHQTKPLLKVNPVQQCQRTSFHTVTMVHVMCLLTLYRLTVLSLPVDTLLMLGSM
jgi:hypothetical protein